MSMGARLYFCFMKYIFLAYYIAFLLKGKKKRFQIFVAFLFMIATLVKIESVFKFICGNPLTVTDILFCLLFIYILLNFLYAFLSPVISINEYKVVQDDSGNIAGNTVKETVILNPIHYTKVQPVRTSPRKKDSLEESSYLNISKSDISPSNNPPPLEVNLESVQEYVEEFPSIEYSGVVDENFDFSQLDEKESEEIFLTESQLPEPETALFDTIQKKNFI